MIELRSVCVQSVTGTDISRVAEEACMRGSRMAARYRVGALSALALVAAAGGVHAATAATAATATTIFVSPSGDDSATGTAAAPVRTLTHARDLARAHAPGVTVQLADGTYRM